MSTQPIDITNPAILATIPSTSATFLMCPPRLYDVNYVINPWMAGNVHASSRTRAAEQWQRLYEAVSTIADVQLVEPQPGSPDMVFTANAGLERNGTVAISSFFHPERQGEEPHFRRWFEQAGYKVMDTPRATPFEGEGDALFSTDGTRLFVGYGPRTVPSSHQALRKIWGIEVTSLHLIDPRFYHLDTCFAPLEGGYVMYFPEAFDRASLDKIEAFYPLEKRIIVAESDAVCFACNAINVDRTIILNNISSDLRSQLESRGFDVIEVTLTEFLKAGGAAKCLVMKLSHAAL
ncbi:dimethylarginine dimethylaminohydrolase family protein [Tunturibacter empetritectus]|uniref:Ornithine--oxo-acid transaminase n=1 Tax=Tunturiibacter empetritectus TaxID=3069691 RepID=A0A7W8IH06_9BACT|nr:arginine deiminase-related protein [Edaphobacter lichenicola]MBB5316206.1 ornithine--oxo-acid transaminase [Edaphobacter lichenicola]